MRKRFCSGLLFFDALRMPRSMKERLKLVAKRFGSTLYLPAGVELFRLTRNRAVEQPSRPACSSAAERSAREQADRPCNLSSKIARSLSSEHSKPSGSSVLEQCPDRRDSVARHSHTRWLSLPAWLVSSAPFCQLRARGPVQMVVSI